MLLLLLLLPPCLLTGLHQPPGCLALGPCCSQLPPGSAASGGCHRVEGVQAAAEDLRREAVGAGQAGGQSEGRPGEQAQA
jgi:hypothetical protein